MTFKYIGENYTPPDVAGKVTGEIKYVEDYQREGMVYARLYTSPIPSGRVVNIDTSEALRMDGVLGVITAEDLPPSQAPAEPMLASADVTYVGQPILAIAAISDEIAETALERVRVDFEYRDFVTDPLESLTEGGPDAYPDGNILRQAGALANENDLISGGIGRIKWPSEQVDRLRTGQEPQNVEFASDWTYGDLEAGFAAADVIIEEPYVTASTPHHCLEPRSGMSYWENGKCYFYGSSQNMSFTRPILAGFLGIELEDLVFINQATGGGFGSKAFPYPLMGVCGHFSRILNRPVQLRITREQEHYVGGSRTGTTGWIKIGAKNDGTITAVDVIVITDGGPTGLNFGASGAQHISVVYTPDAMHYRGIPVFTNTTPKLAQRGPGQNEMAVAIAPIMDKLARQINMDRMEFRRMNAPTSDSLVYEDRRSLTSSYLPEALEKAAEMFNWREKESQPRQRAGSKVKGIGIGMGYHQAGFSGFDGLVRITPDGRIHLHSGVGNLGTYSYSDTTRAAAEVLQCRWESCEVVSGDSSLHLPHSSVQGGSNTTFTHTRANWVAAEDAVRKLKEIAASEFGGTAEEYSIGDERVFRTDDKTTGMTYGEAAARAIELGGAYSGQEYPEDLNEITQSAVQGVAGTGLIGVSRDNMPLNGHVPGLTASMVEIELDLDTGKYEILDYVGISDCGKVLHPNGLSQQINGGAIWGFGMAGLERHVHDPQNGLPAGVGIYQAKLPTIMDVPLEMKNGAVDIPDPANPAGARGVGEPAMGSAAAAITGAIADALDGYLFNRAPVTPDMIVNHLAQRDGGIKPGELNTY